MSTAYAPVHEPEFAFPESAPTEMRFMARQMALVNRELAQHNRKILRIASRWLELFDFVKFLEREDLAITDPLSGQRRLLSGTTSVVRGLGVLLLAKLQNDDAEQLHALGLTYQDLAACVEELGDIERSLESDMTPAMVAEMESKLFNSAQPK